MTKPRADLGFGAALDDLSGFAPGENAPRPRPAPAAVTAAADAAGFRSREPVPPPAAPVTWADRPIRRRRTGRNVQFNLKARAETIDAFCRIADTQDWGLGETLERAVALMEREGWDKGRAG
jgi:hypothetical protein